MDLTVYQTLQNRGNKMDINSPFMCTRGDAWLGNGYYFWDTDIRLAQRWGQTSCRNSYYVYRANITINDNVLDLYGNVEHRNLYIEIDEEIRRTLKKAGKIDDLLVKEIINYLLKNINNKSQFPIKAIRCEDNYIRTRPITHKFNRSKNEYLTITQDRVQVCAFELEPINFRNFELVEEVP